MDIRFAKLFGFTSYHDYFSGNLCPAFTYTPSKPSAKTMKRCGFVHRTGPHGFEVWYDHGHPSNRSNFEAFSEEGGSLVFYMGCNDHYLLNYTELPAENLQSNLYYFSNRSSKTFSEGDRTLTLVSAGDHVRDKDRQKTSAVEKQLKDLDFGWPMPFGVVEIFLDESVPDAFRVLTSTREVQRQDYGVRYQSRSVFWKYYIMDDHLQDLNGLVISNGPKGVAFEGPVKEKVNGSQPALTFTSEAPIPFREVPSDAFQLQKDFDPGAGRGKMVRGGLPGPGIDLIKIREDSDPITYYSEIYLY